MALLFFLCGERINWFWIPAACRGVCVVTAIVLANWNY